VYENPSLKKNFLSFFKFPSDFFQLLACGHLGHKGCLCNESTVLAKQQGLEGKALRDAIAIWCVVILARGGLENYLHQFTTQRPSY
jgi:hypothetical protein